MNTSNLIIRPIELHEADILHPIAEAIFMESYAHLNTPENMATYVEANFSLAQIRTELQNGESYFYFALIEDIIVGYLKLNKGAAQTDQPLPDALEVERIYLFAKYHRQGLGKRLLDWTVQIAKSEGFQAIWLGVWEKNEQAIRFYEKNGFCTFSSHVFHLGTEAQTDLLMKRGV